MIHRDLKPMNILVGKNMNISLIDFGIAKLDQKTKAKMTMNVGTAFWSAPEIFSGKGDYTSAVDGNTSPIFPFSPNSFLIHYYFLFFFV